MINEDDGERIVATEEIIKELFDRSETIWTTDAEKQRHVLASAVVFAAIYLGRKLITAAQIVRQL